MTSTSRQSIATLATDLQEVLAWGEAAEAANAGLRELVATRDYQIEVANEAGIISAGEILDLRTQLAEKDATIAAKDAEIYRLTDSLSVANTAIAMQGSVMASQQAEIARLTALADEAFRAGL